MIPFFSLRITKRKEAQRWLFMGILCIKNIKIKRSFFTFKMKLILTKIQSSGSYFTTA